MAISLENIDGKICPIISCDVCGEKISESSNANMETNWDLNKIKFIHKKCSMQNLDKLPLYIDLDEFMYQLGMNVKYDYENGKELDRSNYSL